MEFMIWAVVFLFSILLGWFLLRRTKSDGLELARKRERALKTMERWTM